MSLLVILTLPKDYIMGINSKLMLPGNFYEIVTNITIVGLMEDSKRSCLVPPAWALHVELVYYFIISIWAGKSKRWALWFFATGVGYLLAIYHFKEFAFRYRYFHVGAGALPFSMGAVIYFHLDPIKRLINKISWPAAFAVSMGAYIAVFIMAGVASELNTVLFYCNLLSSSMVLAVLWFAPGLKWKALDNFLGDLSYPTYLMHWQVGAVVAYVAGWTFHSKPVFLVSLIVVTLLSVLDAHLVSGKLKAKREVVKRGLVDKSDSSMIERMQPFKSGEICRNTVSESVKHL
jgi:peptidoglycan/LPS O-acetylase OafA/YrhL